MEIAKKQYSNWSILVILVVMPFMVTLDGTIVNVALPNMAKDLHTDMETIQLVIIAYLVAVVATMLLFGRLGDIKGKSNMFIIGTIVFTMGSLLCGITKDLNTLIIARVIQGIGGSAAFANNQGIITEIFPANQRGRALGFVGVAVALGTMLGPPLGGFIVSSLSWEYIFLINVPIGLIAFVFALKVLPRQKKIEKKIDVLGAIILSLGVISFFGALLLGQAKGFYQYYVILMFVAAVIFIALFLKAEKKAVSPLIEFSIFKNSLFTISIFCVLIQYFAMSGLNIIQPFFIEDVLKQSPETAGFILMSVPIALGIASPIAGALSDKIGSEKITIVGLAFMSLGMFLLAALNQSTSIAYIIVALLVIGFGAGIFSAPNTSLIMSTGNATNLGLVGSINSFTRNFGMVLGITISTTLLYAFMGLKEGRQVDGFTKGSSDAFVFGMSIVYAIFGCVLVLGILLTVLRSVKYKKIDVNKPEE